MVPLDGSHTKYTDRVEIRAGWVFIPSAEALAKNFEGTKSNTCLRTCV